MTEEKQPEHTGLPEDKHEEPVGQEVTLKDELDEALREKEQFRAMAQRAQADLANYKKRAAEELEEARRAATAHLLLKFLSVVDDLDRALAMVPDDAVAPGWLDGLRLVQRNLDNILESEGVSKINAEGQPFEPWEHEAVFYQETPNCEEGIVTNVVREGYKIHDRVLRAAQVVVSKAPEKQQEPNEFEDKPDTTGQQEA